MALSKVNTVDCDTVDFVSNGNDEFGEIEVSIAPDAVDMIVDHLIELYSDPVPSLVRELISNGVDASVGVPGVEPVEVFLPSRFNPVFRVVDHGVGMSLEQVRTVYSKFGASDKRDDFSTVGSKGLGAKSPLAYVNEFSVSTTQNGVTVDFVVPRAGNIRVLNVVESGLPSGTSVSVSVREQDVTRFSEAVESYRRFPCPVPVSIDGTVYDSLSGYVVFGEVVLDEESGTTGRLLMSEDYIVEYFIRFKEMAGIRKWSDDDFSFVLCGWEYDDNVEFRSYHEAPFALELKPGVVDFNSSRDNIKHNSRLEHVLDVLKTFLSDKETFIDGIFNAYRQLSDLSAVKACDHAVFSTGNRTVSVFSCLHDFDVDLFTTNSGFNPFTAKLKADTRQKSMVFSAVSVHSNKYIVSRMPRWESSLDKKWGWEDVVENIYYASNSRSKAFGSVGSVNKEIKDSVRFGEKFPTSGKSSLAGLVAKFADIMGKIVFVTGVTSKNISTFTSRRKSNRKLGTFFILIGDSDQAEIEKVAEFFNLQDYAILSFDEYREASRPDSKTKTEKEAKVYRGAVLADKVEEYDSYQEQPLRYVTGTMDDLLENYLTIIVGDYNGSWKVLNTLINEGKVKTGNVLFLESKYIFKPDFEKLLAVGGGCYATKDFQTRSVAGRKFAEQNSVAYSDRVDGQTNHDFDEKLFLQLLKNHAQMDGEKGTKLLQRLAETAGQKGYDTLADSFKRLACGNSLEQKEYKNKLYSKTRNEIQAYFDYAKTLPGMKQTINVAEAIHTIKTLYKYGDTLEEKVAVGVLGFAETENETIYNIALEVTVETIRKEVAKEQNK